MSIGEEGHLRGLLRARADEIVADWRVRLHALGGNHALGLIPPTELDAEMRTLLAGISAAEARFPIEGAHPLAQLLRATGALRAARGFTPVESLQYLQTCKDAASAQLLADAGTQQADLVLLALLADRCLLVLADSFIDAREQALQRQSESLREVSTPVITLWDSVLLLPLVGVVDSVRAQLISERLLETIGQSEAEVTLIDVTGVPVMDTSVARHILKTVAAAQMLGTRVILTGISPTTAQTMVKLGIDLAGVPTRGTLKSGVALAMTMTHRQVVHVAPQPRIF